MTKYQLSKIQLVKKSESGKKVIGQKSIDQINELAKADLLGQDQGLSKNLRLSGPITCRTKARVFGIDKVLNFRHVTFNANFRMERVGILCWTFSNQMIYMPLAFRIGMNFSCRPNGFELASIFARSVENRW